MAASCAMLYLALMAAHLEDGQIGRCSTLTALMLTGCSLRGTQRLAETWWALRRRLMLPVIAQ